VDRVASIVDLVEASQPSLGSRIELVDVVDRDQFLAGFGVSLGVVSDTSRSVW
jgi:hypothetical protein